METKQINFPIPLDVHAALKVWCARKRKTMRAAIIEMVRRVVMPEKKGGAA